MYKITPWHYYNTKFSIDDIKEAANFCGGDTKDELQLLDAAKITQKVSPDTVKNLILKSNNVLEKETLKPFGKKLEHLYILCTSGEFISELLEGCESLRGLYITYNKNFKKLPEGFFKTSNTLRKLVINYAEISLEPGVFTGLGNLEELDLQENNITELRSDILCDLPKLQKLILARNKIMHILPNTFTANISLTQIDLSNNTLESWKTDCLSLKYLNLSHNKLTGAVSFAALTQLFQLNLDFNKIEKIDRNIFGKSMEKLDYLSLNFNSITQIEEDALDLRALRVLLLDHNKIQNFPENIFIKMAQLQQLNLEHNDFVTIPLNIFTPLKSLSNLVLSCCNLTNLTNPSETGPENLSSLHLDDNNLTKLTKCAFQGFLALTSLELNDCELEILEDNWCAGLDALKQLNLSSNKLKTLKSGTFKSLTVLKTLNLSGNCIVTIEKGAFSNLSALSTLNLCDNRLEEICEYMFEDLTVLRSLALGNNEVKILKNDSLGCLPNVIYLDLSENRIVDIEDLTFVNIKNLVTLDLGYNGVSKWPNLTKTHELGKLILSYNYLKDFDDRVFSALTSLSQLYIDNNEIISLDPALLEASAIREFNFDECKFNNDVIKQIQALLQARQIRRRTSLRIEPREKSRKVVL